MIRKRAISMIMLMLLVIPTTAQGSYVKTAQEINILPSFMGNNTVNITEYNNSFYNDKFTGKTLMVNSPYSIVYNLSNSYIGFKMCLSANDVMNGITSMVLKLPVSAKPQTITIYKLLHDTNDINKMKLHYQIADIVPTNTYYTYNYDNRTYAYLPYVNLEPNSIYYIQLNMNGTYNLFVNYNNININNLQSLSIDNNYYNISPDFSILITKFNSYIYSNIETKNYKYVKIESYYQTPLYSISSKGKLYAYADIIANNTYVYTDVDGAFESKSYSSEVLRDYELYYLGNTSTTKTETQLNIKYQTDLKNCFIPLISTNRIHKIIVQHANSTLTTIKTTFKTSATILYTEDANYIPITTVNSVQNEYNNTILSNSKIFKPIFLFLDVAGTKIKTTLDKLNNVLYNNIHYVIDKTIMYYDNSNLKSFLDKIGYHFKAVTFQAKTVIEYITPLIENQLVFIITQVIPSVLLIFASLIILFVSFNIVMFIKFTLEGKLDKAEKYKRW